MTNFSPVNNTSGPTIGKTYYHIKYEHLIDIVNPTS